MMEGMAEAGYATTAGNIAPGYPFREGRRSEVLVSEERSDEREPGQHPPIHEQAEPVAEPRSDDTNEHADERVEVLQPDGEAAPVADGTEGREDR
jgi:hypothetical protein